MTDSRAPSISTRAQDLRERIFQTLLAEMQCPADRVGVEDRFVDLGVDSLTATRLARRLSDELGRVVTVVELWEYNTIDALARYLERPTTMVAEPAAATFRTARERAAREEPIAVVGMGCRFPGAPDLECFWRVLRDGIETVGTVPADRPDAAIWRRVGNPALLRAGFLDAVDRFEPEFFGISPREAEHLDPQQRVLLEVAWHALEDAGIVPATLRSRRVGVFIGCSASDYERMRSERGVQAPHSPTGGHPSIVASRLSYSLGLVGPSLVVDTACASSLTALHLACVALREGEADVALTGGVNILLWPEYSELLGLLGALSADGRCRSFDADANGYVRAEGAGVLVLKRLSDALAAGDRIVCLVRGTGANQSGTSNGIAAPSAEAQAALLRQVYERAGVSPSEVHYVEAHGTGTPIGDSIEAQALGTVLGRRGSGTPPVGIGSVKTNIGHSEGAAGIAGLIKVCLAMRHRTLPASLHFRTPNPLIPFEQLGIRVVSTPEPWPEEARFAAVNGFGFGGANAHVILERWMDTACSVLALSGHGAEDLALQAGEAQRLAQGEGASLDTVLRSLGQPDLAAPLRLAIQASSPRELVQRLSAWKNGGGARRKKSGIWAGQAAGHPRVAFLYSGLGGEWDGMGRQLLGEEPVFHAAIQRCDAYTRQYGDISVLQALAAERLPRHADVLTAVNVAFGIALGELWLSWGVTPHVVVGHSGCELAAAHTSGILGLADAMRIACLLGEFGARSTGRGGLAYVALSAEAAEKEIGGLSDCLSIAVDEGNAVVLGGEREALVQVVQRLAAQGVVTRMVATDIAPHSPLMEPYVEEFRERVGEVSSTSGRIPLVSTVTGDWLEGSRAGPLHWTRCGRDRVRLAPALARLAEAGIEHVVQISAMPMHGRAALAALRQATPDAQAHPSLRRGHRERETLQASLCALYVAGVPVCWERVNRVCGDRPALLTLSAATPESLRGLAESWQRRLAEEEPGRLESLAFSAWTTRQPFRHRLAVAAPSSAEMAGVLGAWLRGEPEPGVLAGQAAEERPAKVVFLFPGQDESWHEAGRRLWAEEPVFRASLERCDVLVRQVASFSLVEALHGDASSHHGNAELMQPLLVGLQVSLAALWRAWGLEPAAVVGQGAGEVTAAFIAGALSLQDTVRLAVARGRAWRGPSLDGFVDAIRGLGSAAPSVPLWSSVTAERVEVGALDAAYWSRNLCEPAQLAPVLDALVERGLLAFLVLGPQPSLPAVIASAIEARGRTGTVLHPGQGDRLSMMKALATLGALGHPLDGRALYPHAARTQGLPLYPWKRASYWLSGGAAAPLHVRRAPVEEERSKVSDWLYTERWMERAPTGQREATGTWVLLADQGGFAEALRTRLSARGADVVLGEAGERWAERGPRTYTLRPDDSTSFGRLLALAGEAPARVVHLWSLDAPALESRAQGFSEAVTLGLGAALHALRAAAAGGGRLYLVTRGAQMAAGVGGEPGGAMLWGWGRSVALEQPDAWGALMDLDPREGPAAAAEALVAALLASDAEGQVALRAGARHVLRLRQAELKAAPPRIRPDASYLITGGLGDLGLVAARWLAEQGARRLILASRAGAPPRAQWAALEPASAQGRRAAAIRALEELGVTVFAPRLDVSDEAALEAFLQAYTADQPPICGVFHLAGIMRDRLLTDLGPEDFTEVLGPKVLGALALHHQIGPSLDFFVLYSSAAGLVGPPGQASGAAGNAFLDALARARRAAGLPAQSLAWGPWTGCGMAAASGERLAALGVHGIEPARGVEVLGHLLSAEEPVVAVLQVDWARWRRSAPAAALPLVAELADGGQETPPLAAIRSLPASMRGERIGAWLIDQIGRVLRLPADDISASVPLNTLGMDSLFAVELRNHIEASFQVRLPLAAFLGAASLTEIAEQLGHRLDESAGAPPPGPAACVGPGAGGLTPGQALPLSHGQRALWFLHRLAPESTAYNVVLALQFVRDVDASLLERVFTHLVLRHPLLRTTYTSRDGVPVQIADEGAEGHFLVIDASAWSEEELRRRVASEGHRHFDLQRGPLAQMVLFQRPESKPVMLLRLHHIMCDLWSVTVLMEELYLLYSAWRTGAPDLLRPVSADYAAFVAWQSALLESPAADRLWAYWSEQLRGDLPALNLPTDRPRPPVQTYRGSSQGFSIETDLTRRLKDLAQAEGATLYTLLLSAFMTLMHRLAGQDDILVGSPTSGRSRHEFEHVVGYFVNPVVLRASFADAPSFRALLHHVNAVVLGAMEHQDYPFPLLVERLQVPRDPSRSPVFQVVFVLQKPHRLKEAAALVLGEEGVRVRFGELEVESLALPERVSQFDMTLMMVEEGGGLVASWQYNTALFDVTTIGRMVGHLKVLLASAVATPDQLVSRLPLLSPEERRRALLTWNDTGAELPPHLCLHELFEAAVERGAEAVAVIHRDRRMTYRELNRRANRLGHELRRLGARPNELIAVLLPKGMEQVVAVLGVEKSGAAYVPVDPELPAERVRYLLEHAQVTLALTSAALEARLPWPPGIQRLCVDALEPGDGDDVNLERAQRPEDLAYVIYTSGSTGRPKGVMIDHRGPVNTITDINRRFVVHPGDRVLALSALSFDLSVYDIFGILAAGAALVIPEEQSARDPAHWAELVEREGVTLWNTVPALMEMLVSHVEARSHHRIASLRAALLSGDWIPVTLPDRLKRLVPGIGVTSLGGATEASIWSILYPIERVEPSWRSIPYGRPMDNQRFYVLDEALEPCPIGVEGGLYIGGVGLAKGYLREETLTQAAFFHHPQTGERLYRTGDLGRYLADGAIEFLGRKDLQVKVRGFRIELGEIEATLMAHPAVREAVALAREDVPGDRRLVAYVVRSQRDGIPDGFAGWQHERVALWSDVFDRAYGEEPGQGEATFDIAGWTSSYDGAPIPAEQMHEWVDSTVERIRRLQPKRVLEIGCGTGLLLHRIAPYTQRYEASDLSKVALDHIRRSLDPSLASRVSLAQRPADDLGGVAAASFDVVVINSVVQYFPSVDYLREVLRRAVAVTAPGGTIFLGDIRSLALLEAQHLSIQAHQATPEEPVEDLVRRAHHAMAVEEELVVAPTFFYALAAELGTSVGVEIHHKRGRTPNELNRFRHDVMLHISPAQASPALAEPRWMDWEGEGLTLPALYERLTSEAPEVLCLARVPNARLFPEVQRVERSQRADRPRTAGQLRAGLAGLEGAGVDPEALWGIERRWPYQVDLLWAGPGAEAYFDVVLRRRLATGEVAPLDVWSRLRGQTALAGSTPRHGNEPLRRRLQDSLATELREHLARALPEYMVPSAFVMLDTMPLSPNGKVDRRVLPAPDASRVSTAISVAARNSTEVRLIDIWIQLLAVEGVGIHDNFFSLGGHSLLAVQLIAWIRAAFGVDLPLQAIVKAPTVAEQAQLLDQGGDALDPAGAKSPPGPTVVPAPEDRHRPFPLTDLQQAYWLGSSGLVALGSAGTTYVEIESKGLNIERLRVALQRTIERHEMLRSVVLPDGQQRILAEVPAFPLEVLDLQGLPPGETTERIAALRQRMYEERPDVERWPMLVIRAHLLDGGVVRLHVSFPLLLGDAQSPGLILKDLESFYRDPAAVLPPLELSFRDYVLGLVALRESGELEQSEDYWRSRLLTLPGAPELPLARPPSSVATSQMVRRSGTLPRAVFSKLREHARRAGITPGALLCAVYADVLAAWSKTPHFTLNVLYQNRAPVHPQVNEVVGCFSTTILLEVDSRVPGSFEQRAKRIQAQLFQDIEHAQVNGIHVVREMARRKGGSMPMSMPVVFASTLHIASDDSVAEGSIERLGKLVASHLQTPHVWLDHQVYQLGGELHYNWDAVEEIFPDGLVAAMFAAYQHLLERLASEGLGSQEPLCLVPPQQLAERATVNATQAPVPADLLHGLFARRAAAQPERPALIDAGRGRTLRYGEVQRLANQLGRTLRARGARPNQLVAIVMERGWEQVVAALGILTSGAAYLPIDPALPAERIDYLLRNGEVKIALTQPWLEQRIPWPEGVERLPVDDTRLAGLDDAPLAAAQGMEDLAYVIFTSGSTGLPKGVMIDHRGAVNTILDINERLGVTPDDRVLALSALSFDLSVYDIFGLLAAGGALVIPTAAAARSPAHWAELAVRERITVWNSVPALIQLLVEHLESSAGSPRLPLRAVLLSGDWIPVPLPDRIRALCDGASVLSLGGATEASIWSISFPIRDVDPTWTSIPYGRPLRNQRFHVLDERLEPRPVWVAGELYIGGFGLARGYLRDLDKTNAHFVVHPRTGERLYRTGDMGRYLPGGDIQFLGREDLQVKIQGYRIELGEIESVLEQHPDVRAAAVRPVGDTHGDKRLMAYVVPQASGEQLDSSALRSFLGKKLPEYMIPSTFLMIQALPLSANGKVDRMALPLPGQEPIDLRLTFVPPRDPMELQVARVWEEILGVQHIGVRDSFFDRGGHSFAAVRMLAQVHRIFGQSVPLSSLLQEPTIEHLAALLRGLAPAAPQSCLVGLQPAGTKPPFFCVHAVGGSALAYRDLSVHLGSDQPFYGIQAKGLDADEVPGESIKGMARLYLEAVVEKQPRGPYFLGGWSFGGLVAFEMAQQLVADGETVALVALLDTWTPGFVESPAQDALSILRLFARDMGLPLEADALEGLSPEECIAYAAQCAVQAGILPADVGAPYLQRLIRVYQRHLEAARRYVPLPYDGQILLVRPEVPLVEGVEELLARHQTCGWALVAKMPVEVQIVPGDHFSMVRTPYVAQVAEALRRALDACASSLNVNAA